MCLGQSKQIGLPSGLLEDLLMTWRSHSIERVLDRKAQLFRTVLRHSRAGGLSAFGCPHYLRARKVMFEDLPVVHATLGHHVRAFLAEAKTMTETAAAKDKVISHPRDCESRTF